MSEHEDPGMESDGEGELDIQNIDEQLDQLIPPQLSATEKIERIDQLLSMKAASKKIQKGAKKSIFLSKAVRRRLQNRRSALKSRLRKNKLIDDLNHNETGLKIEVEQMKSKITELEGQLRMALERNSQLERQLLDMKAHAAPSQHLKKTHLDDAEKRPAPHEADSCGTPEDDKDPKKMRMDKCPIFHNFHKPVGRQSLDQTPPLKLTQRRPSHGHLSSSNSGNPEIDGMGVLTKGGLIEPGHQSQPPDALSLDDAAHHPKDDSKIPGVVSRKKLNLQGPMHDSSSDGGDHPEHHDHFATTSENSELKAMNELMTKCPITKQLGLNSNNSPQQILNSLIRNRSQSQSMAGKCPILNGTKQSSYTPSPQLMDYIKNLFGEKPAQIHASPEAIPPSQTREQNSAKSLQRSIPKFSFDSTLRGFNQAQNSPHFKILPDKSIHFRNFNYQIPNQQVKQPRSSFNVSEIHDLQTNKAAKPPSQMGDITDMILGKHSATGNQFSANTQPVHQSLGPGQPSAQTPQGPSSMLGPQPYMKQKKSSFDMVHMMNPHQGGIGPFSNQPFKQSNVPTPENKQPSPWKKLVDVSAVNSNIDIHNFFSTASNPNRGKVQPPMNRHQRYREPVQSSEFEFARHASKPPMTLAQANNLFKKFTY